MDIGNISSDDELYYLESNRVSPYLELPPPSPILPEAMPDAEEPLDVFVIGERFDSEGLSVEKIAEKKLRRVERINMDIITISDKLSEARENIDYLMIRYYNRLISDLTIEKDLLLIDLGGVCGGH